MSEASKLSAHELQFVTTVEPIIDESRALEKGSGRGICVCPDFQILDDVRFYISLALHIGIGAAQCFQANPYETFEIYLPEAMSSKHFSACEQLNTLQNRTF